METPQPRKVAFKVFQKGLKGNFEGDPFTLRSPI
jgi:hypothetical protein